MAIKKVALAGATGNLGDAVLKQLLFHGFEVIVVSRGNHNLELPSSVPVLIVDYTSLDSIYEALKDQDAVVSTLPSAAAHLQLPLMEAAVRAKLERFIPSEYGSDTRNCRTRQLPVYAGKVEVQGALEKAAETSNLSYTLVMTGSFLDWGFQHSTLIDLKQKRITLFDGGHRLYSTSSLEDIGKAIVGVLEHHMETKNRAVYVHSAALSLKTLAELGKLAVGSDGWTETVVSTEELEAVAWEKFKKERLDSRVVYKSFISVAMFAEGFGGYFEKTDNELLGIKLIKDSVREMKG